MGFGVGYENPGHSVFWFIVVLVLVLVLLVPPVLVVSLVITTLLAISVVPRVIPLMTPVERTAISPYIVVPVAIAPMGEVGSTSIIVVLCVGCFVISVSLISMPSSHLGLVAGLPYIRVLPSPGAVGLSVMVGLELVAAVIL